MHTARGRWLAGLGLALAILLLAGWSITTAWRGYQLALFEAEDPSSLEPEAGPVVDRVGFGPLALDVIDLRSGGTVRARPHGEADEPGWPWPWVLVGDHGARYEDAPPTDRAWVPFAVAAALGLAATGLAAWRGRHLLVASYDHTAFMLFGQHDRATRRFGWVPGNGGHGGHGGQAPPYVPYSPEWEDPERRFR